MESKDKMPHPLALTPYVQDLSLIGVDAPRYSQFATDSKAVWDIVGTLLFEDLSGLRVLEAGCNSGVFAFLCAQRGANVIGIDVVDHYLVQAESIKAHLKFGDKVDFKKLSVYDSDSLGKFDIVLALGLLYHLKFWLYALNKLSSIAEKLIVIDTEVLSVKEDAHQARFIREKYRGDETNWWVLGAGLIVERLKSLGFSNVFAFKVGGAYAAKEYTGGIDAQTLIPFGRRGLFLAVRDGVEPDTVVRMENIRKFEPLEIGTKGILYPVIGSDQPKKIFTEKLGHTLTLLSKKSISAIEKFNSPSRIVCESDDKIAIGEILVDRGDDTDAPFSMRGVWSPKLIYKLIIPSKPQLFVERGDKIKAHLVFEQALPPGTYVVLNVMCTSGDEWRVLASTAYYVSGKKSLKVEIERLEAASWDLWLEFIVGAPLKKPITKRVKISGRALEHPALPLIMINPSEINCAPAESADAFVSPKTFERGDRILVNFSGIENEGRLELLWLDGELVPFGISTIEQDSAAALAFDTVWFPLGQGFLIVNRLDGKKRDFLKSGSFRCDQGKSPIKPDASELPFAGFAFKKVVVPRKVKTNERLKIAVEYEYFPKDIWPMITIAIYRSSSLICKWDSWRGGLQLYQEGGHFLFVCPKLVLAPDDYEVLITAQHPTRGTFGMVRKPIEIKGKDET